MGACCGMDRKVLVTEKQRLQGGNNASFKFSFKDQQEEKKKQKKPKEEKKVTMDLELETADEDPKNIMFRNKTGQFMVRLPGTINGAEFEVEQCQTCQLYAHDKMKNCSVNMVFNSSIVLGPIQGLCQINICNNSKIVVFCNELKVRDCTNLEIMLFSPNLPAVEACTNIKFVPMTYCFDELLSLMREVELNPWVNNWNEAIDMTPQRVLADGEQSWTVDNELQWNFIPPLGWAEEAFNKVQAMRPADAITGLHQIMREDLVVADMEYTDEGANKAELFNMGEYFQPFAPKIFKGVLPEKQFIQDEPFKHVLLLVVFVEDFEALYDSTNAVDAACGTAADLTDTLQYKLLTICGNFIKVNKKTKKQVAWIQEMSTLSCSPEEKQQIVEEMETIQHVGSSPEMVAIAIEFRIKPLVSSNSVAGARSSEGESKVYKQLKQDCVALQNEHPNQVCFTMDADQVNAAADIVFQQVQETITNDEDNFNK